MSLKSYLLDPLHLFVAVEHDGHALRRPHGVRVRRSVRRARARRREDGFGRGDLDRADRGAAAERHQRRRLEVLRRLPSQAAAEIG